MSDGANHVEQKLTSISKKSGKNMAYWSSTLNENIYTVSKITLKKDFKNIT